MWPKTFSEFLASILKYCIYNEIIFLNIFSINKWKRNERKSLFRTLPTSSSSAHDSKTTSLEKIFIFRDRAQIFIILTSTKLVKVLSIHQFIRAYSANILGLQINHSQARSLSWIANSWKIGKTLVKENFHIDRKSFS